MKVTTRDREFFEFLLRFGFLTTEQVSHLWEVDFSTAAARVRKLEQLGLIERAKLPYLSSRPLLLTASGAALVGGDLKPQRGVRPGTFAHDLLVFDLASALLRKFAGSRFETEREYRLTHPAISHLPDGVLHRADGTKVACELELTPKSARRLRAIIDSYAYNLEFDRVWYFVLGASMRDFVKRVAGDSEHVRIIPWRAPIGRAAVRQQTESHQ